MRGKEILAAAVLAATGPAQAQTLFFDDFSGNDLEPHWVRPPPEHWRYEVRDGSLHVQELFWPSNPHTPFNEASISADFSAFENDFHARIRVRWDPTSLPWFDMSIDDETGQNIAFFGGWSPNLLAGTRLASSGPLAAPAPGMHEFVIHRVNDDVRFFLNQQHVATLPSIGGRPGRVVLGFLADYPDPGFTPLSIDFVRIVPAPATVCLYVAAATMLSRRRRP